SLCFSYFILLSPFFFFFFFSSRRRHTRWPRDWSSDVCSSDLSAHLVSLRSLHASVPSGIGDLAGEQRQCSPLLPPQFPPARRTRGAAKWGLENHPRPAHSQNTSNPPCLLPVDSFWLSKRSPASPIESP